MNVIIQHNIFENKKKEVLLPTPGIEPGPPA